MYFHMVDSKGRGVHLDHCYHYTAHLAGFKKLHDPSMDSSRWCLGPFYRVSLQSWSSSEILMENRLWSQVGWLGESPCSNKSLVFIVICCLAIRYIYLLCVDEELSVESSLIRSRKTVSCYYKFYIHWLHFQKFLVASSICLDDHSMCRKSVFLSFPVFVIHSLFSHAYSINGLNCFLVFSLSR